MLYDLENLEQRYGGRTVLHVDSLQIEERSILGLSGPNGSGKSTLMRILAFLETPAAGRMLFEERPVNGSATSLRRQATLLTQETYLLKRSVKANVAYGLRVRGRCADCADRVAQALDMVGLDHKSFLRRSWTELSGGEAQRVALASRLVLRPRVLLLDEPTASVDRKSTELIRNASLQAREQWGVTLVIVSHDMDWLESVCDSVQHIREGRLEAVEKQPQRTRTVRQIVNETQ